MVYHPYMGVSLQKIFDIYIYKIHLAVNMRQKLITLDPTSFEIASKMPNFSDWVRRELRKFRDEQQRTVNEIYHDSDKFAAEFKLRHGRWPQGYRVGEEE